MGKVVFNKLRRTLRPGRSEWSEGIHHPPGDGHWGERIHLRGRRWGPDGDFPELRFIFLKAPTTGKKSACF